MENYRFTLPQLPASGKLTTVYHVDGGAARNAVLTTMAAQLSAQLAEAGRPGLPVPVPVLMIDWDTESPGLHEAFQGDGRDALARPGLLEYFAACRAQLALLHDTFEPAVGDDAEARRARQVVEAVDWEPFIERVDDSRPLYLMRAGCFDDSYGERAAGADWEGLFAASPSLLRSFADHLARRFGHILVASRGGRSAAVSVCTSILADRLLLLFSPSQRSLAGACGVARRAIEYRSSHEDAQRPLLLYPLPVELDGADQARRLRWRHGDPRHAGLASGDADGYQSVMEQLMRESYALPELSLDSYFDHVQLQQLNPMAGGDTPHQPLSADRLSLARAVADLLEWLADGSFPWQGRAELTLSRRIATARAADPDGVSPAVQAALAADLFQLGGLQQQYGRAKQALASIEEGASLQAALWGTGHPATRAGRLALARQLRHCGKADAALAVFQSLFEDCAHELGHTHPDTLAARAGVVAALADCQQFDTALVHAGAVVAGWRERCGLNHGATLEAQALHATTLAHAGDPRRARMLIEQVLEGRERILGVEHADTLATQAELAVILRQLGQLDMARDLQEQLFSSRQRLLGPLSAACRRRYGHSHPPGRSAELDLAARLVQEAALAAPRPHAPHQIERSAPAGAPHESGFTALSPVTSGRTGRGAVVGDACTPMAGRYSEPFDIERSVIRLEQMDDLAADEARELADRLREPVLTAGVPPIVRQRGVRAILGVYFYQGDTDAVVSLMQEPIKQK
jgi:tetratricopeptide (TPR) repeat protein